MEPTSLEVSLLDIALHQRIKSTDFPLKCRAMYYFAKGRHAHQDRKASGKPYFVHPRGVAFIVMMLDGTNAEINAALAHDLLEDTETSFPELLTVANSVECAELCSELRNNPFRIDALGKEEYMSKKLEGLSDSALFIKLADMLYNSYDDPAEKALTRMYHNVCNVLLKRKMSPKCEHLARMIMLA